ncbi:glycoside hydrolase family 43 protein [Bacteroides graminisolvens]|uniref:glycoside hydrolase family 43 protein n=1 Tax=Bacteroides graminisolvens TaxID=477666 RepID=UPI00240A9301|nr:glycoside hydrolase family 43 protein [Bacteroides graminisolvens]
MRNKRDIIIILLMLAACGVTIAQTARFRYFSYNGNDERFDKSINHNNQYFNPILAGYYPDPSICRKGDTYYLATSSFSFFPGVPVFTSKDMVNWTQTGHALDRDSQISLHNLGVSDGLFAPSLTYNEKNDTFYMLTMNMGKRSVFFVKTKDPAKGWSEPISLKAGGMDASFFFDNDGKAYIVYCTLPFGGPNYQGEMAIHMNQFCLSGDTVLSNKVELIRGGTHIERKPQWLEGPHLYHIGKYYYLMCAEGGTRSQHSEVIFRSKTLIGPWEEFKGNPILTQRNLTDAHRTDIVTSTGHADLIQTPEGDWWAVFLGCRPYEDDFYNTGRDTYLLPVKWKNNWPVILDAGKAVPTVTDKRNLQPANTFLTGNFAYTDRFENNKLNMQWIFLRNPQPDFYSLVGDGITLKSLPVNIMQKESPAAIFTRQQHTSFTAETEIVFTPQTEKEIAGMVLFQNEEYNFVFGKTLLNGKPTIILSRTEGTTIVIGSAIFSENQANQPLKLKVEGCGRYYSFYYAVAGGKWQPIAHGVDAVNLSTNRAGGFTGNVIGLYTTSNN